MGGLGASCTRLLAGCLVIVACQSRDYVTVEDAALRSEALPTTSLQVSTNELLRLDITQPG